MFMYTDYNQHLLDNVKKIHFIGCGGSGMYPLAQILHTKGYYLTGSDNNETETLQASPGHGASRYIWDSVRRISRALI